MGVPRATAVLPLFLAAAGVAAPGGDRRAPEPPRRRAPEAAASRVPCSFEENRGQAHADVRFLARPRGYRAFFTDDGATFVLPRGTGTAWDPASGAAPPAFRADALRMRFDGVRARPAAAEPLAGRSHYLLGNDPAKWVRHVPHSGGLAVDGAAADVRWRGLPGGRLAYEVDLPAGSDRAGIAFEGAAAVEVGRDGALLVRTAGGVMRHTAPVAWQEVAGARVPVRCAFEVPSPGRAALAVAGHDRRLPVTIDPELEYATYIRGAVQEQLWAIAVDAERRPVVSGWTYSPTFPTLSPFDPDYSGGPGDAVIAQFNREGTALLFSTFLGGAGTDNSTALALDAEGAVYVTGLTGSSDFPVKNPIYLKSGPGGDAFVTKLTATGSELVYSTYIGGTEGESVTGIAVAQDGTATIVGHTASVNYPTVNPLQGDSAFMDGFVSRLDAEGSGLAWSTYLGGNGVDYLHGLALDGSGNAFVVGQTQSSNFPVSPGAFQASRLGGADAFVTRILADGSSLAGSTLLGGTNWETAYAVAVDPEDRPWVCGETESIDFPLLAAVQSTPSGSSDGFVTRLSAGLGSILSSTRLGGEAEDRPLAIAVDRSGSPCVTGWTRRAGFPVKEPLQATASSPGSNLYDMFITSLSGDDASLLWSTYWGGAGGHEIGYGVCIDDGGTVRVAGSADSAGFATPGAFQTAIPDGWTSGYVIAIGTGPEAPTGCLAGLAGLTRAIVNWTDASDDETSFRIERSEAEGPWLEVGSAPADATSHEDTGLDPLTDYAYRVRAVSPHGVSHPSNEAEITTPPTPTFPPLAPTGLAAVADSPYQVTLTWNDASNNEDFFSVARRTGAAAYAVIATPRLGATSHQDTAPLPDRTYTYRVRAVNPVGPSSGDPEVAVTLPPTVDLVVEKGRLRATGSIGAIAKDRATLSGTVAFLGDSRTAAFDPEVHSLRFFVGDWEGDPLLFIPAGDDGWKEKRSGLLTWKSPKGSFAKTAFRLDPATGAWSLAASRITIQGEVVNPVRVTVGVADEGGHAEDEWTPLKRPGDFRRP